MCAAGPRDIAWLQIAAYGLSPREREVVEQVVRGASTRQIASTLFIAEDTVQDHLSHIFEKVGVRVRRALIKRLYFDRLDPVVSSGSEAPDASRWPVIPASIGKADTGGGEGACQLL
jgi:DNA-binding CsgD family transcriptional regulator